MFPQSVIERGSFNRTRRTVFGVVALMLGVVLGITGTAKGQPKETQKLDLTKKLELDANIQARSLDLPAQPGEQTLTVEFTSTKGVVSMYVFKQEDAKGDDELLTADPKKALASARAKAGMIKVDVPEKTAVRVIFREANVTTVEVKITNQIAKQPKDAKLKNFEAEMAKLHAELKKIAEEADKQVAELNKQIAEWEKEREKKAPELQKKFDELWKQYKERQKK